MALIQKQRSYAHEKALEKRGVALGYRRSERAFASRGQALGHDERVDVVWSGHPRLPDLTLQSKRMKAYPVWLQGYLAALDGADVVVMRQDRDRDYALLPLDRLIELLDAQVQEGPPRPASDRPRTSPALRSRRAFFAQRRASDA